MSLLLPTSLVAFISFGGKEESPKSNSIERERVQRIATSHLRAGSMHPYFLVDL